VRAAVAALALLAAGCTGSDDTSGRDRAGDDYASSQEGRAAILQARREAALKLRADGPASYMSRRYAWIEGSWIGATDPSSDTQMKASFSRDAISMIEIVDADGRTLQISQGSMNLEGGGAQGRLQAAAGRLAPYATWTATPQPDGTIMLTGHDARQILRRDR
jgi:hypothetical protein